MKMQQASQLLSLFVTGPDSSFDNAVEKTLQEILRTVRQYLGMEIAFISEFSNGQRIYRYVDSMHIDSPIRIGGADPLETTYCLRVTDGRLPQLIADTSHCPEAADLPLTKALPVGSHLGVPLTLSSGRIYGTLCCLNTAADPSLTERDLGMLRAFADLAARQIEQDVISRERSIEISHRIKSVLANDSLSIAYQPIYHLGQDKIVGFESLSRFIAQPLRSPDIWFAEAAQAGLGIPLEARAIQLALQGLQDLPEEVYLSINASPEAIMSGAVASEVNGQPLERLVLEITEHALIDRYDEIATAILPLRRNGMRIAVDDAGAGYASFRHILNLAPDIIKLDMSLTRNIDSDPSKRALAAALVRFSEETGSTIVAEGVETLSELGTLRQLAVNKAQGYVLGKPMPVDQAAELCRNG